MDFLDRLMHYFQVSDDSGLGNTLVTVCHEWNTSLLPLSSCLELLEATHDTLQHLRLVVKCGKTPHRRRGLFISVETIFLEEKLCKDRKGENAESRLFV